MSGSSDFLAAVQVAYEVRELRPDYRALLVVATGLRPGPSTGDRRRPDRLVR